MLNSAEHYFNEQPQTKRGVERCIALLNTAAELFVQKGYEAVSLDDIVQHAGGSKASIYKFFGSKDGLFRAICDYKRKICFEEIYSNTHGDELDIRTFFTTILQNVYTYLMHQENIQFLRLLLERANLDPELANYLYDNGPQHVLTDICQSLIRATEQGLIVCEHPEHSAKMLLGSVWHFEWQMLMGAVQQQSPEEINAYIHYSVKYFLKAHEYKQFFDFE